MCISCFSTVFSVQLCRKIILSLFKPHNMPILGSFHGLRSLVPHHGYTLEPLGAYSTPPHTPAVWKLPSVIDLQSLLAFLHHATPQTSQKMFNLKTPHTLFFFIRTSKFDLKLAVLGLDDIFKPLHAS